MSSVSKSMCLSPKKKSSLNSPDAEGATQSASKFSSGKKRKVDGGGTARVEAEETTLRVKLLTEHATAPKRGSAHAAGYDISSARDCVIPSGGRLLVETDVAVALPEGTYGRVAPRSGLALKSGINVGAGVIDADYRGPLGVLLFNHSDKDFEVKCGDRVAQLVIEVIRTPEVEIVETLEETLRGDGGFGSTGVGLDVTNTVETK